MQVSRLFNWVSPENCICWVDYIEWPCDGHGWMICRYRTLVYALAALSAYREIVAPGNPLRFHVADLLVQDLILWMFLQCYQARECSRLKPRASQLVSLVPVVSLLCLKSMKESEAYRSCGSKSGKHRTKWEHRRHHKHSCAQVPVGILAELTAKKFQATPVSECSNNCSYSLPHSDYHKPRQHGISNIQHILKQS